MKKFHYILLLPLIAMLGACSEDVIDDLSGTYSDVARYNFSTATVGQTEKLGKGLKELHIIFGTETAVQLDLSVVSREWTLQAGNYTPASDASAAKAMEYIGNVIENGSTTATFTDGQVEVNLVDGDYIISGLLYDAAGKRYVINYRGALDFVIGEDDPEPSGYIVNISTAEVGVFDYTTFQYYVIPGVSKYTLSITDPDGAEAASFELINTENLAKEDLAGTYTIAENATSAGLMCNGYYFPDYGAVGGSYSVAAGGAKQYLSSGTIELSFVTGISGDKLLNIKGSDLGWAGPAGSGTTSVNIPFATVLEKSGIEIKDLSFTSSTLGRDVKYSVLLPTSFDGTKKYPVLYMLHGASGGNNDWLTGGNIASYTGTADTEMVIVMPQASFDGFDTFYVDNYLGAGINYETFFIDEFMPAIEAMYCGNGKRGLAGLSMGGYGTLYYGLKYADKFAGMYACSPVLAIDGIPSIYDMVWMAGPAPFTVEIGTEDFLYELCKGFNEMMPFSPLMPTYTYVERSGAHDWAFWSACSPKIVTFFDEMFAK